MRVIVISVDAWSRRVASSQCGLPDVSDEYLRSGELISSSWGTQASKYILISIDFSAVQLVV
jgi:hypothetical protein